MSRACDGGVAASLDRSFFRPFKERREAEAKWPGRAALQVAVNGEHSSEIRSSNPARELDACLRDKVKLRRAYGECLGSQRR